MILSTVMNPGQIGNYTGRCWRSFRLATAQTTLGRLSVTTGAMHFYLDSGIGRIDSIPNRQANFLRMPPASTQNRVGNRFVQSKFHAIEIPLTIACSLQIQQYPVGGMGSVLEIADAVLIPTGVETSPASPGTLSGIALKNAHGGSPLL